MSSFSALLLVCGLLAGLQGIVNGAVTSVGGAGYGVHFSWERSDMVSRFLGDWDGSSFTLMFWVNNIDEHQSLNCVTSYTSYDSSETPSYDAPDEMGMIVRREGIHLWRSGALDRCETDACTSTNYLQWRHLVYTWRESDGLTRVYMNGDLVYTTTLVPGAYVRPNGVFMIGQEPDMFAASFNEGQALSGLVDEVALFQREFSAQEVKDYVDRGQDREDPDLVLYWSFDDPTNFETTEDLSTSGRDGWMGYLDNRINEMTYSSDRLPQPPTLPPYVVSQFPIAGHGPAVTPLRPGETVVDVRLSYATNDTKTPVDRTDLSNPTSDSGSTPSNTDYWAGYESAAVTFRIESTPSYGILRDPVTSLPLQAGDEASAITVSYELDTALYSSSWLPLIEAAGSPLAVPDVFTYSVNGIVGTGHIVASQTVQTPAGKEYSMIEDEPSTVILGGVDIFGELPIAIVKTLPERGRLFQAAFDGEPGYGNIITDPEQLVEITVADTFVEDSMGVVVYIPDPEASSDGLFDSFLFAWQNEYGLESAPGNLTLYVSPVNDGPVVSPVSAAVSSDEGTFTAVQLESTDTDETFSNGEVYYKIQDYPQVGSIFQYVDGDEPALGMELEDVVDITVIQYPNRFMNGSSQYSSCSTKCFQPWKCDCDEVTDYHWTQALGPPDVYPAYGDSIFSGAYGAADTNYDPAVDEFLEFGLAEPFYLTEMTVYETYKPGSIVGVSASDHFDGTQTEWTNLWSGIPAMSVLTMEESRAWEVPLCPHLYLMEYFRFDCRLDLRPSWEEFDAVQVIGTTNPPAGYVQDRDGRIAYVARPGVFSNDGAVYDTFTYSATDCLDFSVVPETITITVDPPTDGAVFSSADHTLAFASTTIVTVSLTEVVTDALEIGVSEVQIASLSARIVSYQDGDFVDMTLLQVEGDGTAVGHSFSVGDRLDSSTGTVSYVIADGTNSEARFAVHAGELQGDVDLGLWVTLGDFVYAVGVEGEVRCPVGYWNRATDGVCVACRFLSEEDVDAAFDDDAEGYLENCDLELCDAGTYTVWIDDANFECVDCQEGYYAPEAGMSECLPCEAGSYSSSGMSVCISCAPGYYSDAAESRCHKCSTGTYAESEGAASCTPCAAGYYQDNEGQDHCSLCPPGHYADQEGLAECTQCPPHTSNVQGVVLVELGQVTYASIAECYPEKGWYGLPAAEPTECPHGGVCCYCEASGSELLDMLAKNANEPCSCLGGTESPYPKPGFTRSIYNSLVMIECSSHDSCLGGDSVVSDGVCKEGHEGYRCGQCEEDYYMIGSSCSECVGGGAIAATLVVIIPLIVLGILYMATLGLRLSSLHVLTDTLQLLALMYYLPIQWDAIMEDFFVVCALANFNPQILQTECAFTFEYFGRSGFLLCFPLIWAAIWLVTYLMVRFITPKLGKVEQGDSVNNLTYCLYSNDTQYKNGVFVGGMILVLILLHPLLFSKGIEPFVCDYQEDGYYYMLAAPEYRCFEDDEWKDNIALFLLGLLLWGCGIPAGLMYILYRIRLQLFNPDVRIRYGVIYKGYKPSCYWWDIMALGRASLFMAFIALFTAVPSLQILCTSVVLISHALGMIYFFPDRIRNLNFANVLGEVTLMLVYLSGLTFDHAVATGTMSTDARADATIAVVTWTAFVLVILSVLVIWEARWTYKEVNDAGEKATSKECEMIFRDVQRAVLKGREYIEKQKRVLASLGFHVDFEDMSTDEALRVQIVEKVEAMSKPSKVAHVERVSEARRWSLASADPTASPAPPSPSDHDQNAAAERPDDASSHSSDEEHAVLQRQVLALTDALKVHAPTLDVTALLKGTALPDSKLRMEVVSPNHEEDSVRISIPTNVERPPPDPPAAAADLSDVSANVSTAPVLTTAGFYRSPSGTSLRRASGGVSRVALGAAHGEDGQDGLGDSVMLYETTV